MRGGAKRRSAAEGCARPPPATPLQRCVSLPLADTRLIVCPSAPHSSPKTPDRSSSRKEKKRENATISAAHFSNVFSKKKKKIGVELVTHPDSLANATPAYRPCHWPLLLEAVSLEKNKGDLRRVSNLICLVNECLAQHV